MKRRQFTLTIDTESDAFRDVNVDVTDHDFHDDGEHDGLTCVCGEHKEVHDDGYDRGLEVARILRELAQRVEDGRRGVVPLVDTNGNVVGTGSFVEVDVPDSPAHETWCDQVMYARWSGLSCNCGAKREGY